MTVLQYHGKSYQWFRSMLIAPRGSGAPVKKLMYTLIPPFILTQGYYVFVDVDYANEGDHKNDQGRLHSPIVTSTSEDGMCLSFWYHMYGEHVNQLNIYIQQRDYETTAVWSRTGTQGQKWNHGQVKY